MGTLRGGDEVSLKRRLEAAEHLQQLPSDYKWIFGAGNIPEKPFLPNTCNEPLNTKAYANSALAAIFLEMAEGPLAHFQECINVAGQARYEYSWVEMDKVNLLKFIGLLFHFDIERKNDLKNHWSTDKPNCVVQKSRISRDNFLRWYYNIVLYKKRDAPTQEKRFNKIFKVEKYLDLANKSMCAMRNPPSRDLSLDEEMAEFAGRSNLIQLIPSKPHSQGLKYYVLADPTTGYSYRCHLHSANEVPFQDVWGRIIAICYNLLRGKEEKGHKSYLDQGYCVFTDRYYSTVAMNYSMSLRNTYFVGTLRREQRANLPQEIMEGSRRNPTPSIVLALKTGQVLKMHTNYGDTEAVTWKDNRPVTFLSSIGSDYSTNTCSRKRKKVGGGYYVELVQQPAIAKTFNEKMGGVDRHDYFVHKEKQHRRSVKWYVSPVFLQSLYWFVANSFILWRDANRCSNMQNKHAKQKIADDLFIFADLLSEVPKQISCTPLIDRPSRIPIQLPVNDVKKHRLDRSVPHYPRSSLIRNSCKGHVQRVDVDTFCSVCGVYLCISGGCFERFHENKLYLFDDPLLATKAKLRVKCFY